MKKSTILTLTLILTVNIGAMAQKEELKAASEKIDAKDYVSALANISAAKKKVEQLVGDQLGSVLPKKFGEFEMVEGESMGGQMMGGMSVSKNYQKPAAEPRTDSGAPEGDMDSPENMDAMNMPMDQMMQQQMLRVEVTTNMMMASEVQMAHSEPESSGNQNVKAIRIKGYRAMVRTESMNMGAGDEGEGQTIMEDAKVIVGGALVSVNANGMDKPGVAEAFLNEVDFDKLIQLVGK